jgi:hypothetical protein
MSNFATTYLLRRSALRGLHSYAATAYLARFQTRKAVPVPTVVNGPETTWTLSSSPEMLKEVFRSAPFQFGKVLLSVWVVIVLSVSLNVYFPN